MTKAEIKTGLRLLRACDPDCVDADFTRERQRKLSVFLRNNAAELLSAAARLNQVREQVGKMDGQLLRMLLDELIEQCEGMDNEEAAADKSLRDTADAIDALCSLLNQTDTESSTEKE